MYFVFADMEKGLNRVSRDAVSLIFRKLGVHDAGMAFIKIQGCSDRWRINGSNNFFVKVGLHFLVTLFTRSLPYVSFISPTWNLGLLLGLSKVLVFCTALPMVTQSTCLMKGFIAKAYRIYSVSKFCLKSILHALSMLSVLIPFLFTILLRTLFKERRSEGQVSRVNVLCS